MPSTMRLLPRSSIGELKVAIAAHSCALHVGGILIFYWILFVAMCINCHNSKKLNRKGSKSSFIVQNFTIFAL